MQPLLLRAWTRQPSTVQWEHLPELIKFPYVWYVFDRLQLQVLVQVARTSSYTAAARALGYTQPAVSYQMRQLERAATTALVIRAGRGIQLTNAGRRLAAHAQTVLAALDAAETEMVALSSQERGLVRLAAFQSSCAAVVPELFDVLARAGANLQVEVHQMEPPAAAGHITSGTVDIGLLCDWENEPVAEAEQAFSRHPLLTDRRCVLFPLDHPLAAHAGDVDFADLAGEAWVLESARDRFLSACATAGFRPRVTATADDSVTIQSLVAAGAGITLVNELGLVSHLDRRLAARPLTNWPVRRIYACTWPQMGRVASIATVLDALTRAARQVTPRLTGYRRRLRRLAATRSAGD